jgi:predicted nucleic acid-binding protein
VPEAQAMALMQRVELGATVILLEELAARAVAREIGLNVFGFVGVLIDAAQRGLITPEEVRQVLETCRQKGTHYSDRLIEFAVRRAGGESNVGETH